ncbi:MAG: flagellar hook assembly protein FlgD [Chloroflexota bacterium]
MEVQATGSYSAQSAQPQAAKSTGSDQLAKADFLGLLVAQLKYQDPMKPMDNSQFVAQLAQLQSLEQAQQANEALLALTYLSQLSQASSLIGRTVTAASPTGEAVSGTVSAVHVTDGVAELEIDGRSVLLHEITDVT